MVGFSGENAQELVKAALSVGLEVVALVATVAQVRTCHDVSVLLDTLIPDLAATTPCCYNTLLLLLPRTSLSFARHVTRGRVRVRVCVRGVCAVCVVCV